VLFSKPADAITERFPDAGDSLLPVAVDVTDEAQIAGAITAAVAKFGRIDVVVEE